ncbi:MAG: hypothetical protein R2747_14145 [Pyrinomonadaceae bacterium]
MMTKALLLLTFLFSLMIAGCASQAEAKKQMEELKKSYVSAPDEPDSVSPGNPVPPETDPPALPDDFDASRLSADGQKAYRVLLEAERHESRHVGIAGTLSHYVKNFDILLKEKEADAAFKSILKSGTIAGQLYALSGIYKTDRNFFNKALENYKNSDRTVTTVRGCLVGEDNVARVAQTFRPEI